MPDVTLAAAAMAGVTDIHPIGGAQAIAALAYGTESVRAVDVIVGPGNMYVAVAKQEVAGTVGIPSSFSGPSEVVVVADDSTDPDMAAIDLIAQAEHGPGGLSWLISWDGAVLDRITSRVTVLAADSGPPGRYRADALIRWLRGPLRVAGTSDRGRQHHRSRALGAAHECARRSGAARTQRRGCVLRTVGAGFGRRLHGGSQSRSAHERNGEVRERAHGARFHEGHPRGDGR